MSDHVYRRPVSPSADILSAMHTYHTVVLRFVSVIILHWIDPALVLSIYAICCSFFALGISQGVGVSGIVCLYFLFFFESICYPVCPLSRTIHLPSKVSSFVQ
jgi:fucose permease